MPQYCDSERLEKNWFCWLLASTTPQLEPFRAANVLWTKVLSPVMDKGEPLLKNGRELPDPAGPKRVHCLAFNNPVSFVSVNGQCPKLVKVGNAKFTLDELVAELTLESNSPIHRLHDPFNQQTRVVPDLLQKHYIQEPPICQSWDAVLIDINRICHGITMRFKPKTPEDHADLTNEVFVQVSNKLATKRLVYTPGKAPVFNLLTTTIYRCLYSIMNRRKSQRDNLAGLLTKAQSGGLPEYRSLRTPI